MAVETAADRLSMFNINDFGTLAYYKSKGKRYAVEGIFDREYNGVDVAEVEVASTIPVFFMPTANLPCAYAFGDALEIDCAQVFTIRNIESDGTGISKLRLEATS
jgi:hypothetical protein